MTMAGNTVTLHRVLRCPPDKVYRAFITPGALAQWLPPEGFYATVHHLQAEVGGTFRMSFTNFTTSATHAFGGEYLELIADKRLRYTDAFDEPSLPGTMTVTVTLTAVSVGTDIAIEQSGIPAAIPIEACYVGWQQSLANLARLVEPTISD